MRSATRRIVLGLGAVLLVGGWGATRYADEQQQMLSIGPSRILLWVGDEWKFSEQHSERTYPSKTIYAAGIIGMAVGAGLIGFALPRVEMTGGEQ